MSGEQHKNEHTWAPGQSGNPGGRSPRVGPNGESLPELARGKTMEAFNALVSLLSDEAPDIRLRAANAILDRGWGKPKESVDLTSEGQGLAAILASLGRRHDSPVA